MSSMFNRLRFGVKSKQEPDEPTLENQLLKLGAQLVDDPAQLNENVRAVCRQLGSALHSRADQVLGSIIALHAARMLSTVWTVLLQQLREAVDHRSQLALLHHFSNVAHRISIPQRPDAFKVFGKAVLSMAGSDAAVAEKRFATICEATFVALGAHADCELCHTLLEKFFGGLQQWSRTDAKRTASNVCAVLVRWTQCCGSFVDLFARAADDVLARAYLFDSALSSLWDHAALLCNGQGSPEQYYTVVAAKGALTATLIDLLAQSEHDAVILPLYCSSFSRLKLLCRFTPWSGDARIAELSLCLLEAPGRVKAALLCPLLGVLGTVIYDPPVADTARCIRCLLSLRHDKDPMVAGEALTCLGQCVASASLSEVATRDLVTEILQDHHNFLTAERCNMRTRGALVFFAKVFSVAHVDRDEVIRHVLRAHLDFSNPVNSVPAVQCQVLHLLGQTINEPNVDSLQYICKCVLDTNARVCEEAVANLVAMAEFGHFDATQLLSASQHSLDFCEGTVAVEVPHRPRCSDGKWRVARNCAVVTQFVVRILMENDIGDGKDSASRALALSVVVQAFAPRIPPNTIQPMLSTILLSHLGRLQSASTIQLDILVALVDACRVCVTSGGWEYDVYTHREMFSLIWTLFYRCCACIDPSSIPPLPQQPSLYLFPSDISPAVLDAVASAARSAMSTSAPPEGSSFFHITQALLRLLTALIDVGSHSSVFLAHMRLQFRVFLAATEIASSQHPVAALQATSSLFRALFTTEVRSGEVIVDTTVQASQREKFVRSAVSVLNRTLAFDLIIVADALFSLINLLVLVDCAFSETVCYRALDPNFALFRRMCAILLDKKFYNAVSGPTVMPHIAHPVASLLGSPYISEVAKHCTVENLVQIKQVINEATATVRSTCFNECLMALLPFEDNADDLIPIGTAIPQWSQQHQRAALRLLSGKSFEATVGSDAETVVVAVVASILRFVTATDAHAEDFECVSFAVEAMLTVFTSPTIPRTLQEEVAEDLLSAKSFLSLICLSAWDADVLPDLFVTALSIDLAPCVLDLVLTLLGNSANGGYGASVSATCVWLPDAPSGHNSDSISTAFRLIHVYPGDVCAQSAFVWRAWWDMANSDNLKEILLVRMLASSNTSAVPRECLQSPLMWTVMVQMLFTALDCPFTEGEGCAEGEQAAIIMAIGKAETTYAATRILEIAAAMHACTETRAEAIESLLQRGGHEWCKAKVIACRLWAAEELALHSDLVDSFDEHIRPSSTEHPRASHPLDNVPFKGAMMMRYTGENPETHSAPSDDAFEQMCFAAQTIDDCSRLVRDFLRAPLTRWRLITFGRVIAIRRAMPRLGLTQDELCGMCGDIERVIEMEGEAFGSSVSKDPALLFSAVLVLSSALPHTQQDELIADRLSGPVGQCVSRTLCVILQLPSDTSSPRSLARYCASLLLRTTALAEGIREALVWLVVKWCQPFVWEVLVSGELCDPSELCCIRMLCKMQQTVGFTAELIHNVHAHYTPLLISFGQEEGMHHDEQRLVLFLATSMLLQVVISEERHSKPKVHASLTDDLGLYQDFPLDQMCSAAASKTRTIVNSHIFPSFQQRAPHRGETNWNIHAYAHLASVGGRASLPKGTWDKSYVSLLHMYIHVVATTLQQYDRVTSQSVADVMVSLQLLAASNPALLKHTPAQDGTAANTILQTLFAWYGKAFAAQLANVESRVLGADVIDFRGSIFPQPSASLDFLDWNGLIAFTHTISSLATRGSELLPGAVDLSFVLDKMLSVDVFTNQSCHAALLVMAGAATRRDITQVAPLLSRRLVQDIQRYAPTAMSCSFGVLQLLRTGFTLMQALSGESGVVQSCQRICKLIIASRLGGRRIQFYAHFLLQAVCTMHDVTEEHWQLAQWQSSDGGKRPGFLQKSSAESQGSFFCERGVVDSLAFAIQERVASWRHAGRGDDHLPLRLSRRQDMGIAAVAAGSTASLLSLTTLSLLIIRSAAGGVAASSVTDTDAVADRNRVEILSLLQELGSEVDAVSSVRLQVVYTVACEVLNENDGLFLFLNKFDFGASSLVLFSQHVPRAVVACDSAAATLSQLGLFFDTSARRQQHENGSWWVIVNLLSGLAVVTNPNAAATFSHGLWPLVHTTVAEQIARLLLADLLKGGHKALIKLFLKSLDSSVKLSGSVTAVASAQHVIGCIREMTDALASA